MAAVTGGKSAGCQRGVGHGLDGECVRAGTARGVASLDNVRNEASRLDSGVLHGPQGVEADGDCLDFPFARVWTM